MQTGALKMKKSLSCQYVSWGLVAVAQDTLTENCTYIMVILRLSLTAI
jgi:hypothetical protein